MELREGGGVCMEGGVCMAGSSAAEKGGASLPPRALPVTLPVTLGWRERPTGVVPSGDCPAHQQGTRELWKQASEYTRVLTE